MHRSIGVSFDEGEGLVTVRLVERGRGVEVQLEIRGYAVGTEVVLTPELTAELGQALTEHAGRARDG